MLSRRENFIETIKGGKPDRFVKQFEFMSPDALFADPFNATNPMPFFPGDDDAVDLWGVTWSFPAYVPGAFPVQDEAHLVLKDITQWESYVKAPSLEFPDEVWEEARKAYDSVDRKEFFAGPMMSPGVFERLHTLIKIEDVLLAFYMEPEVVHELIDYCVEWECAYVKQMAENLHPDIVFHHDDWGSKLSTFVSPDMFEEFFLKPYKKLYGCYKDNGFLYIVHHCDSYARTLVPYMIEMGIDVWQGGVSTNDLSEIIAEYGPQLSIMSGVETAEVDRPDWNAEMIQTAVDKVCRTLGGPYFIPCQTQGGPMSTVPEVYGAIDEAIDAASAQMFANRFAETRAVSAV